MLSVNHLDVRFGEKHLFKDISQRVHAGDRVGLVGVNGAGKSTLLKIMTVFHRDDQWFFQKIITLPNRQVHNDGALGGSFYGCCGGFRIKRNRTVIG
ncbi:MAG: ATP-binding cassette domain-containing protein, partial [Proteobacteria bacterium]|nr:ATP-binding cassette domain-containing protein [Pseudomonadota bacterium]